MDGHANSVEVFTMEQARGHLYNVYYRLRCNQDCTLVIILTRSSSNLQDPVHFKTETQPAKKLRRCYKVKIPSTPNQGQYHLFLKYSPKIRLKSILILWSYRASFTRKVSFVKFFRIRHVVYLSSNPLRPKKLER